MEKARYWHPEEEGAKCDLCPHACRLREGQRGLCRSRVFRDGALWSSVYGHPCALAIDPVEKKPLNHFLPGTCCLSLACRGCNLRCLGCQNWEISQSDAPEPETWSPENVVRACLKGGWPSIAYTYTEPLTWWEYTYDIASLAHARGLKNILVSAGYINAEPLRELAPFLDAANIDLKSLSDETYRRICGATLAPVQRTLEILRDAPVELEITNLVIPGINDSEEQLTELCKWLADNGFRDCPLHFSRFFPQYRMREVPATPVATLRRARAIARAAGIRHIHPGNVPGEA